jgi:HSP20 family protein
MIRRTPDNTILRDPLFEVVDRFFGDRGWPSLASKEADEPASSSWVPAVDLRETEEAFFVTAELPGLSKKNIDISLEGKTLTISGERTFKKEGENDNYHRVEREYGSFRRSFSLPTAIEADKVSAKFKDGLLTLSVPKSPAVMPRKIAVS